MKKWHLLNHQIILWPPHGFLKGSQMVLRNGVRWLKFVVFSIKEFRTNSFQKINNLWLLMHCFANLMIFHFTPKPDWQLCYSVNKPPNDISPTWISLKRRILLRASLPIGAQVGSASISVPPVPPVSRNCNNISRHEDHKRRASRFVKHRKIFRFLAHFNRKQGSGSWYLQPTHCTIKGKSLKTPMHLHCLIPPKWVFQWSLENGVKMQSQMQRNSDCLWLDDNFRCFSLVPQDFLAWRTYWNVWTITQIRLIHLFFHQTAVVVQIQQVVETKPPHFIQNGIVMSL